MTTPAPQTTGISAMKLADLIFGSGGVLAYHNVTAEPFLPSVHVTVDALAEHLSFITSHYHPIRLSEWVARRHAGRSVRGCVAVCFDDAYEGVLRLALPLLERHQVPATVFVTTAFVERRVPFWWDRLEWLDLHAPAEAKSGFLARWLGPKLTSRQLYNHMNGRYGGRLPPMMESDLSAIEPGLPPLAERCLSPEGLGLLAESGLIDFAPHTETHPALPKHPFEEQIRDIRRSHEWLAARLPRVLPYLAYPYGLYDASSVRAAQEAGMSAAFTMQGHAAVPWSSPLAYPRVGVAGVNTQRTIRLRLSWLAIPVVAWRNRGWHPGIP